MVKFNLTINKKQRTAYFNKTITDTLGFNLYAQLNAISGVIYPKGVDKADLIRSLEIILADLEHQFELEKKLNNARAIAMKPLKGRRRK